MKKRFLTLLAIPFAIASLGSVQAQPVSIDDKAAMERLEHMAPGYRAPKEDDFIHIPPTMEDLEKADMHPELKEVIRKGHDLFVNTQQLRGVNVFNTMNCSSCHMGEGRLPNAGPIWPAAVTLPDYRPKNDHVNSLEERIAGCFMYSMNGIPPAYGGDEMLALSAYHQWLATGVPMYQAGNTMYGRGYARLPDPEQTPDMQRGAKLYQAQCAMCHGADGQGVSQDGQVIFPALWGDGSFNWGAGISRSFTLAAFTKQNMPLGRSNSLTDQEAWDIATFVDSQERPQDPRYTGDIAETRAKYVDTFHKHTVYGTEVDGKVLGDHSNTGEKPALPEGMLRHRTFDFGNTK